MKYRLKTLSILIVLAFILSPLTAVADSNNSTPPQKRKFIILTRSGAKTKERIEKDKIISYSPHKSAPDVLVAELYGAEASDIEEQTETIVVSENIKLYADTEEMTETTEETAETTEEQPLWNIQMINAEELPTQAEEKIRVGVMDSGINGSSLIEVQYFQDYINEGSFIFQDLSGHGTSVAGVIASDSFGINKSAELYSIKVMGSNNEANLQNVISGIYWAIENHIKILNMSFGTSEYSEALQVAVNDAINAGVLIIASAGNSGAIRYPAAFPGVVAVGSIDHSGEIISENVNDYSEILLAPGEEVLSVGDFATTISASGTSMATPHVTAVAAALWEMNPEKSNMFIKDLLFATANTSLGEKVLDAEKAIEKYAEFSANYNEYITPLPYPNTTEITTFDDVTFEALWSGVEHQSSVTGSYSGISNEAKKILKVFSAIPDEENLTFNELHGTDDCDGVDGLEYKYKNGTREDNSDDEIFVFTNYFDDGTNLYFTNMDINYIDCSDGHISIHNYYNSNLLHDTDLEMRSILHGRENYVTSLRFLYTVASNLWTGNYYNATDTTRRKIIRTAMIDALPAKQANGTDARFYEDEAAYGYVKASGSDANGKFYINKISYSEINDSYEQLLMLQAMIYLAANCKSDTLKLTIADDYERFQKEAALKVLGISLHLLGDVYAHRSIIPEDIGFDKSQGQPTNDIGAVSYTIFRGNAAGIDFHGGGYWSENHGLRDVIPIGMKMTTTQIRKIWQQAGTQQGEYEDNVNFLPKRYDFTVISVEKYLKLFFSKADFSPDIFKIGTYGGAAITNANNQRLAELRRFVKFAGYSLSGSYLKYYDSKATMSDFYWYDYNTDVNLKPPTGYNDTNWFQTGVVNSA